MTARPTITETVTTWREATGRQHQLNEAGYLTMAVDMGETITVFVWAKPGGRDLEQLPPKN